MARVSRRRLARHVVRMITEQPERQDEILRQLAGYLIVNKQTRSVDLLLKDMADELHIQKHHLAADITYALDITSSTRQAITTMLKQKTGAQTVELHEHKDPSLIGGVVVRTPRQQIDTSIRTQLNAIAKGMNI